MLPSRRFQIHTVIFSSVGAPDPVDVVEELVIERAAHLADRRFDILEMDDEAGLGVRLALDGDAHMERMAVNARIGDVLPARTAGNARLRM